MQWIGESDMKTISFFLSLPCFWYGYRLVNIATPPEFYVDWNTVATSWLIGMVLFMIASWKFLMAAVRFVEQSFPDLLATPSRSRKMIRPHARMISEGRIRVTGDVDKLQRGMHYQVSTGTWTRLDKGGWDFECNLNDWQTSDLVEMINTSEGI